MHGLPGEGTGGAAFAGDSVIGELVGMIKDYQRGRTDERWVVHNKLTHMLEQVKRLEIHQSAQVTLQELIVWLDDKFASDVDEYLEEVVEPLPELVL